MVHDQPNPYGDTHMVDTPEQTRLEFSVAGIGSRFLALAVDTLIQAGAALLVVAIAAILGVSGLLRALPEGSLWQVAVLVAVLFALYYAYFAVFEIVWRGQTPGKRVVGIRVVKDSGRPLSAAESIGRNLLRIVDQLPGFYAVGVITALISSRHKRLGDFIAGSVVVRERSLAQMRPVWHTTQTASAVTASPLGADRLTADDLALIDAFLHRRYDLAPDVRSRMATDILRRIEPHLSVRPQPGMSTEAVLEALAVERRRTGGYS